MLEADIYIGCHIEFQGESGVRENGVVVQFNDRNLRLRVGSSIFKCVPFTSWDRKRSREAGWLDWKVIA